MVDSTAAPKAEKWVVRLVAYLADLSAVKKADYSAEQ